MHLRIRERNGTIYLPYQLVAHQTRPLLVSSYEFPKKEMQNIKKTK
jgi:hypothetical protein